MIKIMDQVAVGLGLFCIIAFNSLDNPRAQYWLEKRVTFQQLMTDLIERDGIKIAYARLNNMSPIYESRSQKLQELQAIPAEDRTKLESFEIGLFQSEIQANPSSGSDQIIKERTYTISIPKTLSDSKNMDEAIKKLNLLDERYSVKQSDTLLILSAPDSIVNKKVVTFEVKELQLPDVILQFTSLLKNNNIFLTDDAIQILQRISKSSTRPITINLHNVPLAEVLSRFVEASESDLTWYLEQSYDGVNFLSVALSRVDLEEDNILVHKKRSMELNPALPK